MARPEEIYWKGDWQGMLWIKFGGVAERDQGINILKEKVGFGVWVAPDREVGERVVRSFLLGLKRQLVGWGFGGKEVQVELSKVSGMMRVGRKDVLSVIVVGTKLKMTWEDATWGQWEDLMRAEEYKTLVAKAEDTLSRSGAGGKAKGKGKAE